MHRVRLTLAAACLALVAACGLGNQGDQPARQTSPSPIVTSSDDDPDTPASPRTLTSRDNRSVVVLETGQSAELLIRDPHAPDPVLDGTAVQLIEVTNVTRSGVREWEVQAVEPGLARLHATENDKPFEVTFRVR